MPKSLKVMLRSMRHNGTIDEETYATLLKKLEGHDRELIKNAEDAVCRNADVVKVVRCLGCYYYNPVKEYLGMAGECNKHGRRFAVWCNGFCSLGVRKEEFIHGSEESESTD